MLLEPHSVSLNELQSDLLHNKQVELHVLRLDKIHPIISGNKLFKLHYYIEHAIKNNKTTIATFGGAYSNHLVATAYACKLSNLKSIGIVRGEKPAQLSHTLQHCIEYGMQLHFVSREEYDKKTDDTFVQNIIGNINDIQIIPEGGYGIEGAKGASLIMHYIPAPTSHIVAAVGTGTTLAGLLQANTSTQTIIGINVLKGITDLEEKLLYLTNNNKDCLQRLQLLNDYHFGGYAKKTPELIDFMNSIYTTHQLPTDFVYTAKMMYAVFDSIKKDRFPPKSKIVCIHTGGLQGNLSLPTNSLMFK